MGTIYNPTVDMDRLALYFDGANIRSYVGTGTTWNDISGNNSTASTTGLTYVGTGVSAYFNFNGSFTGPVTGVAHLQYGTGPRTVMAWVRPSSAAGLAQVFGWGTVTGNAASGLAISNGGKWSTFQHNTAAYEGSSVTANVWVHVAVTQSSSGTYLYLNGTTMLSRPDVTITVNQGAAYIGGSFQDSEKWNGFISKVMFYNKALTQSEINNYFRGTAINYGVSTGAGIGSTGVGGAE
jgi:hypothetical protein